MKCPFCSYDLVSICNKNGTYEYYCKEKFCFKYYVTNYHRQGWNKTFERVQYSTYSVFISYVLGITYVQGENGVLLQIHKLLEVSPDLEDKINQLLVFS